MKKRKILEAYVGFIDSLSNDDNWELENQEKHYNTYLRRHIAGVQAAFNKYILPLLNYEKLDESILSEKQLKDAIYKLQLHIGLHDLSKWSVIEYEPYRMHWYPTQYELNNKTIWNRNEKKYELAWSHHWHNNPHHPQYWIGKDMPLDYILEMLCDWISVSNIYSSSVIEWYEDKADKEKSYMTDHTRQIVEYLLYKVLGFTRDFTEYNLGV